MLTIGQETTSIAPHFETRPGKRRWLDRDRNNIGQADASVDGKPLAAAPSVSKLSAEEVEP
jgi:hypothetical protein